MLRIQLKPPIAAGAGPAGTRLILEVASAQVKGDRLRGEMLGAAAADWLIVSPEGTGTVVWGDSGVDPGRAGRGVRN
jgi:hypothetical protein